MPTNVKSSMVRNGFVAGAPNASESASRTTAAIDRPCSKARRRTAS